VDEFNKTWKDVIDVGMTIPQTAEVYTLRRLYIREQWTSEYLNSSTRRKE